MRPPDVVVVVVVVVTPGSVVVVVVVVVVVPPRVGHVTPTTPQFGAGAGCTMTMPTPGRKT